MSRTILAKADGFTPVIDKVMKDTSLIAAVVFGAMWRYCQMKNGVCQATLEKIGERAGLSRQAVIEHIKKLEETGYIQDMTPELRNRPHTYKDTGKAGLHIAVSGVNVVDSENDFTVNDVDSAVNDVDSHSTPRVLEDSIKIEVKKEFNNKQIPEILAFTDHFGHFNGKREQQRWVTLYQAIGDCRAEEIAAWAERQEIHMTNRGRLMDSLETAAKKWTAPQSNSIKKETFYEKLQRA